MSFCYSAITSRKNEKIIGASKLCDKKFRDREGIFFAEGAKLLDEIIKEGIEIESIFFTQKALDIYENLLLLAKSKQYYLVTDEVYEKLTSESAPQGIFVCAKKRPPLSLSDATLSQGAFIILEDIQNPQNLGAILRCAYSLGAKKIILTRACADVYSPKTLRSAMGSAFKCDVYFTDDICETLEKIKEHGKNVYCTHLHSQSLTLGSFSFKEDDSVVIGNEGRGVSADVVEKCTNSVIIPMYQGAESLNAATASSIIIWEMNKSKLLS